MTTYCDHCRNAIKESITRLDHVPINISNANAGEGAYLCSTCMAALFNALASIVKSVFPNSKYEVYLTSDSNIVIARKDDSPQA
jgi:hypothetical protein